MHSSRSVRLALPLLLCLATGCSGGLYAEARLETPAQIPLRAFPRIVVVAASGADSEQAADALAQHLRGGASGVRRATSEELAQGRADGALPPATVALRVELVLGSQEPLRLRPPRRPTCGFVGCVDPPQPITPRVEEVFGRLELRVSDGPSGRTLQREVLEDGEVGDDPLGARLRVTERLLNRARAMLDQRERPVRIPLLTAGPPSARAALDLMAAGDWAGGRRVLEQVVRSAGFDDLSAAERAYLLYDLGQARRFDDSVPPEERLTSARQSFTAALELSRDGPIVRALEDLEAQARAARDIRAQRAARSHNFAVGGEGPTVPQPPGSYSD